MRAYFVLSFGMVAAICFGFAVVHWSVTLRDWDMPWRALPSLFFGAVGLWATSYAVIALFTTYRK